VLALAVFPAQIIDRSPLPRGFLPRLERHKALSYLFPDEDAALLACSAVMLVRRLLYGVLVREGMRTSEALRLSWQELDLVRGHVRLDTNKTKDPRAWALDPGVVAALVAWSTRHNASPPPMPRSSCKQMAGR
jgi:integrase